MASFTIHIINTDSPQTSWLQSRPSSYNPQLFWNEDSGWTDIEVSGGGRYKNQIIVIGQTNTGNGCIYFSDV